MQFNLEKALFYFHDPQHPGDYYNKDQLTQNGIFFNIFDFPLHYAGDIFEGERFFFDELQQQFFIWALKHHAPRCVSSMKAMYIMKPDTPAPYIDFVKRHLSEYQAHGIEIKFPNIDEISFYQGSEKDVRNIILETAKRNIESGHVTPKGDPGYVRPVAGRGKRFINGQYDPALGLLSYPFEWFVAVMVAPWGAYAKPPVNVIVHPEPIYEPLRRVKAQANYGYGSKSKNEAVLSGLTDVLLTHSHQPYTGDRYIQELTAMNIIFIVGDKKLVTPYLKEPILPGVTRLYTLYMGRKLGYEVEERRVTLNEVMEKCRAAVIVGTATGVVPVDSIADPITDKVLFLDSKHKIAQELSSQYKASVKGEEVYAPLRELRDSMRTPIEARIPN